MSTPPHDAIGAIIRNWWRDACQTTWREDFADAVRRDARLEELATRLTAAVVPFRARIACLTAAAGILRAPLDELWRWACTEERDGQDPRAYVRQVCQRAFSNPVVERLPLLRHPPDDSASTDVIPRIAEVLTSVQGGGHVTGCPAAVLQTLLAAECSPECRTARALRDALGAGSSPTRRA